MEKNSIKARLVEDISRSHTIIDEQFKNLEERIAITKDLVNDISNAIKQMKYNIPDFSSNRSASLISIKMALNDLDKHLDDTLAMASHDIDRIKSLAEMMNDTDGSEKTDDEKT